MSEVDRKDWTKYGIGAHGRWEPFEQVWHTTHVTTAIGILQEGAIRNGLVFDESRLNKRRVLVAWLSPNDWTPIGGFRYGNVGFGFNWEQLLSGRTPYWIGCVQKYTPPACRFLLTERQHDKYTVYDPSKGDGPWWFDVKANRHFFNRALCMEFMVEAALSLKSSSGVRFVDHKRDQCSLNWRTCKDNGMRRDQGMARYLAGVVGMKAPKKYSGLLGADEEFPDELQYADKGLKDCWRFLKRFLEEDFKQFGGTIKSTDAGAKSLAAAVLLRWFLRQPKAAEKLAGLFATEEEFIAAVHDTLNRYCKPSTPLQA